LQLPAGNGTADEGDVAGEDTVVVAGEDTVVVAGEDTEAGEVAV
jgi:hypothetical protein